MGTTADKLIYLNNTKTAIKSAIEAKGVPVSDIAFREYASKISEIETSTWVERPSNWLPQPKYTEGQQQIDLLVEISPNSLNDIALAIETSEGTYSVNWGDGNIITGYTSGETIEHIYDYSSLPNTNMLSSNAKQTYVTITPDSGNITIINLNKKHTLNPKLISSYTTPAIAGPNPIPSIILEFNAQAPFVTELHMGETVRQQVGFWYTYIHIMSFCNIQNFNYQGTNLITNGMTIFDKMTGLKNIQSFDTSHLTTLSLRDCKSLTDASIFNFETMASLSLENTNNIKTPIYVNTAQLHNVYNIQRALYSSELANNLVVKEITIVGGHNTYTALENNVSLEKLRILNMLDSFTTVNLSYTNLDAAALEIVFLDLYDRTGLEAGEVNLTRALGTAALTQTQRDIALNKNYNLIG